MYNKENLRKHEYPNTRINRLLYSCRIVCLNIDTEIIRRAMLQSRLQYRKSKHRDNDCIRFVLYHLKKYVIDEIDTLGIAFYLRQSKIEFPAIINYYYKF